MNTIKDICNNIHSAFSLNPLPRRIKMTSAFYAYFRTVCPVITEDSPKYEHLANGVYGQFTGIPIEVDDTIENEYYEIVY